MSDTNYAPHLAVLLKSIEANKGAERVRVHAILDGVDTALLDLIRTAVPELDILDYHVIGHPALELPPIMHISRATYLRLIMPEILPAEVNRVLYLDIDMVVTQSLRPLWQSDLQGRPFAAVEDHNLSADDLAERFSLPKGGLYFNAGMLLIDMQAERVGGYLRQALERLKADPDAYPFADQDALNEVLWQNWTRVDINWNYQRAFVNGGKVYRTSDPKGVHLPGILHFTEHWKPWKSDEWHPYAWLYWQNLRQTPFFAKIRQRDGISLPRLVKFWLKYRVTLMRSRLASLLRSLSNPSKKDLHAEIVNSSFNVENREISALEELAAFTVLPKKEQTL
nr:glycosyltransferase family 8 protein [Paracoccus saliphilus]